MSGDLFSARDGLGNPIEPHNSIFPILKEVGPNKTQLIGTGFFITMLGHFVTAKHVIEDVLDSESGRQSGFLHALHFVEDTKALVRHITNVTFHNTADLAVGKMDYYLLDATGKPLTNRVPRFTTESPSIGSRVISISANSLNW